MWGRVVNVARRGLTGFLSRGDNRAANARAMSGPVSNTAPKSSANGKNTTEALYSARAAKVTNKSLRRVYLEKCEILSRGA